MPARNESARALSRHGIACQLVGQALDLRRDQRPYHPVELP
ncbi:hypothetical protein [Kitasatospora sp. NPDC004272]